MQTKTLIVNISFMPFFLNRILKCILEMFERIVSDYSVIEQCNSLTLKV